MSKLDLTIACQPYDRVTALQTGAVGIDGCEVRFLPLRAEEIFHRAYEGAEWEVCELSMSSYILTTARGISPYVAIPVFPSRMFRHSAIYVRTDRGIREPADLRGKRVGVPEFQMTAAMCARGMLSDEYGVAATEMSWRTGGLEQPGRKEKFGLTFGNGLDVIPVGPDRALAPMLRSGEIDALISARAPSGFGGDDQVVERLFPDYRAAEEAYYRKTGIFPIMHVIGIRRDVAERYPWLAVSVTKGFERAKRECMEGLHEVGAMAATLPWLLADVARTEAVMGPDYWPYGVRPNLPTLTAMLRWSFEQQLSPREVKVEELFAPGTYDSFKV